MTTIEKIYSLICPVDLPILMYIVENFQISLDFSLRAEKSGGTIYILKLMSMVSPDFCLAILKVIDYIGKKVFIAFIVTPVSWQGLVFHV